MLAGSTNEPVALHGQSEFTIKGQVRDGVQVIEIKIFDPERPDQPLYTTTWVRDDGNEGPVNYILTESDEYTFVVDHCIEGHSSESIRLKQVLENALDLYIDGSIKHTKTNIELRRPVEEMIDDMNGIVLSSAGHFTEDIQFEGFSPSVRQRLEQVGALDWSNVHFAIDGSVEQDKYVAIYHYVNRQVESLKDAVHQEISGFANRAVLEPTGAGPELASAGNEVFDENDFMIPLDLRSEEEPVQEIELVAPEPAIPETKEPKKVRKRDKWLMKELDAINRKIDRIENKAKANNYDGRLEALEDRLAEIRDLLEEKENPIVPRTDNPIADLSQLTGKNITVRFDRYSNYIEEEYQLLLNELFVELARNPAHKILITGYADKSGDSSENLTLSERRAKAVKYYFQNRGIEGERLLVNYFGDSRSTGKAPEERRVEIEWLIADRP